MEMPTTKVCHALGRKCVTILPWTGRCETLDHATAQSCFPQFSPQLRLQLQPDSAGSQPSRVTSAHHTPPWLHSSSLQQGASSGREFAEELRLGRQSKSERLHRTPPLYPNPGSVVHGWEAEKEGNACTKSAVFIDSWGFLGWFGVFLRVCRVNL